MSVSALKVEVIRELLNTDNSMLIKHIKALFETQRSDWWDEVPEDVKESVDRAIKQADKGEYKTHAEVMKKYKKWRRK